MATKIPVPATRFAVIRIGYDSYVLPVKDAAQVVEALARAENIEHEGYGDERLYYIGGGKSIDLQLELLPEHSYLQGKLAGSKSTYTHDQDDINV